MTFDDALDLQNRSMIAFDVALGTGAILAPDVTLKVLGHAEPSDDARELFRRCGPIWLTFAAAHALAAARGKPEDWWALAWLRGTEVFTDVVWSRSPAFRDTRTRATLVGAGIGNLVMALAFWGTRPPMILLTGGTGTVGRALLRRLVASRTPVRCLVRDPKGLGPDRVRVQIALGDLAEPASFRNALRGVNTVVHLAASIRDQPKASIEELNAMATLRLVRAAERSGAKRFIFMSAMGASLQSPTRFFRSKALARGAVESASLSTTVFTPSIVYSPGDPWLTLLERLALLPVVPIAGGGKARFQPIWAEDVADCLVAALERPGTEERTQFDLAGPESLSYDELVRVALRPSGRERPLVHVPMPVVRGSLRALERVTGPATFATADEADLMEEPMVTTRGTADAEALGVNPLRMGAVLAAA